jgi:hypothetical protein
MVLALPAQPILNDHDEGVDLLP